MEDYNNKLGLECVICLSPYEDNEVGRNLPKCGHGFHVDCIDMWLHSHSNCPICRAPVLSINNDKVSVVITSADSQEIASLESVRESDDPTDLSDSGNSQTAAANDDNLSEPSSSSLPLIFPWLLSEENVDQQEHIRTQRFPFIQRQ